MKTTTTETKSAGHICFAGSFEFLEESGEVFRAPKGAPLADMNGGKPRRHGRWECSRAHFDRYHDVIVGGL